MHEDANKRPVERLFPFVLRSNILVVGRDALRRRKGRLQFVLVTTDLSDNSTREILQDFAACPIIQHYTGQALETHLNVRGTKVVGFLKSGLARSLHDELKGYLIHRPKAVPKPPGSFPTPPTGHKARPRLPSPHRGRR